MFAHRRLERKIDALHYKVDLILEHLGIQEPPAAEPVWAVPPPARPPQGFAEVDALLAQGKKIQAIKRYRELTGSGLKEAKDAVEGRYGRY
ncbi:ribosomal L7/L12-like protein [Nocardia tenerifensis]|uniref:Ribosomal L7/L12-like protein n=1 Tax=Nocardia tenerifensis TaxID=228006 RepID=A0A318JZH5_9NOCA|nr:50S ribosomal protein L7/L12 [Nocardia tenerifensis]PXX59871.1 ribosomal L7/L12-like protein [Nocardia tenerifensis]